MKNKIGKIVFAVILAVMAILMLFTYVTKKVKNRTANLDSELLRSKNYAQVTDEQSKVENTDFVKFSAFFTRDINGDGNAEKLLGTCKRAIDTDQLYMDLNVLTNGYLKDGKITINGTNFKYSMSMVKDSVLKNNYISDDVKVIELNNVNAGTQKLIIGNIVADIGNNVNNYSSVSSVTLTGTHVSDDGVETEISKTVDLTVDWYGVAKTELYTKYQATTFYYNYNELDSTTISFNFRLDEIQQELILKENETVLTIPELNGYAPTEVKCTNSNIESEYNNETKKLTIKRSSKLNNNGIIVSELSNSNSYNVNITYPKEAYDAISSYTTLTIPIEGFYTGYNNTNEEFKNPYKSNVVNGNITIVFRETPDGNIYNFYVDFEDKRYIKDQPYGDEDTDYRYIMSKQDILNLYDNIEDENKISNKEYVVRWLAVRGDQGEVPSMIMSETKGEDSSYGDKWNTTIMENYITNTGIYFSDADKMLENDGTISIYNDDTNELIHTFTKEEWNNYTRENPYKYVDSVKHIRAEISKTKQNSSLRIYNVKELDTKKILADFTKEEVEDINLIYTYVTGICNIEGQQQGIIKDMDCVYYVSEKSNGKISVETERIPTQDVLNNKIYISAETNRYGDAKWKDGEFLVELPQEIIRMEINKVSIDNENVKLVAYDLYENDGKYFIKIITSNENPESFKITVDCDMTPDPRSPSINRAIKLYSYNKYRNIYYHEGKDEYDVDSDNNTNENVGTSITNFYLLSPTSLITLETITNYNKENEITIAPNVAALEKDQRQAQINVGLTNNYPNVVSGVQILGKIPFEGNKFILNDKNLASNFTTTMTNDGITIPEELKEKTMVYYSEKENPDKDLLNADNGWTLKEDVKDFSKIKTYLIDLTQYTIDIGKNHSFSYTVNVPEGISYNSTSYSNHAVFYELNTSGGKLQLSTEPNKVGLRIVRKYKLQINKSKQGFEQTKVSGATYTVDFSDAEGNVTTRILTTNSDGIVNMKNLFIGVTYTVKELKSPDNYSLNNEVLQFKVIEDETGKLQLETNFEKISLNKADELVIINTQDEPKYNVTITKIDSLTKEPLTGVYFICNGKAYITDRNGKITLEKLEKDIQYTLKELNTEGYYTLDNITFKLVKAENENIKIESNNENFKNAQIQNNEEDLVEVNVNLENEKIPTYNLQILKVEENLKETDIEKLKPLKGSMFKLEGKDLSKEEKFETDENGNITIPNLYQYVDGKAITGKYILQELQAPNGYSNNAEEIEFNVVKNAENNLEINITNKEQLITLKDVIVENGTIKLIIQDKPLFKLTKTDSKTGKPLANAQFVIYEIDSNKNDIDYAKDVNGNYVGTINNDGKYVVTTNETGTIVLPLRGGFYRIEEIGYPEGYQENENEDYFKIASKNEDIKNPEDPDGTEETVGDLKINTIEDLVRFSKSVNSGNSYKEKTVSLMRTLDFNEDSSYANPADTSFGDLNEDGVVEGIKKELTTGIGFTPIGTSTSKFMGTFDGRGNEIKNLYIMVNINSAIGLFAYIEGAEIKNCGVTGGVVNNSIYSDGSAGGIVGDAIASKISNCHSYVTIKAGWTIGGIVGRIQNTTIEYSYNIGEIINNRGGYIGGIVGEIDKSNSIINKCYNLGIIKVYIIDDNVVSIGGVVGYISNYNSYNNVVKECYNSGNIRFSNQRYFFYSVGGLIGRVGCNNNIVNSYNTGNIDITGAYATDTGGICGYTDDNTPIINCYNIGEINTIVEGAGPCGTISGNSKTSGENYVKIENCYYLDTIELISEQKNMDGTPISKEMLKTMDFYNKLNVDGVWQFRKDSYPKLNVGNPITNNTTELKIENTIKKFNITTEIEGNSKNEFIGGTISGEDNTIFSKPGKMIKYVETVDYNDSNKKDILIMPDEGYLVYSINLNGEPWNLKSDENGNYTIPSGFFSEVKQDYHIAVKFEKKSQTLENSKSVSYEINKIDKDTNEPIQGAKFAIYKLSEYYETIDFIKNNKNEYLGKQNENGIYELETDADGKIKLELAPGLYKAVETKAAEGYALEESEALRTTYFRAEEENKEDEGNTNINNADLVINNIEDLVRFSNDANSGNSYEGKTVVLARTLDFNEDSSYNNPEDTTFGDYNADGTVEGIKQELAKEEGTGFKAVGNDTNPFKGTFNGNEHEIKNINIYANESSLYGGIIGKIVSGKIMNLGIVDAKIICNSKASGGIVGNATDSEIINCYNKGNLTTEARAPVEGIAGEITNSKIIRCYNEANITGNCTTGIVYYAKDSIIENCYNAGDLNSTAPIGGIAFNVSNSEIINCHNNREIKGSNVSGGIIATDAKDSKIINCYNLATISGSNGSLGGIVGSTASNSEIIDCYNEGKINSNNVVAGIVPSISNSKIFNCYNTGKIIGGVPAGGIVERASDSEIINCYNNGEISGKYGSGGIVGDSLSNSKIINCYNTGKIIDADSSLGGIFGKSITNSTLNKCYYLNSSAAQGVYNQKDIEGQVEAKTQEVMQSEEFVKQLNINKDNTNAQIPLSSWSYNEEGYPTLLPLEIKSGKQLTITNKKLQNNLTIKKVDKETNQKLSGAKFSIKSDSKNITITTNEEGIASTQLPSGKYKIKETIAPFGYNLSNEEKTILISGIDDVQEVTFENEKLQTKYDEPNVIMTKKDKATGEVMSGVKFMVLDEQGNYAKDYTGAIVGEKEEIDGQEKYVVTTDENGQIKLKLKMANYKMVEVKTLDGYALDTNEEQRTTYFRPEPDIKIECIEDLVKLSNSVNSGEILNSYINVELLKTLDFNDESCYKNANDTETFGDYNGDGKVQGIKEELTNVNSIGFKPIGENYNYNFTGTFDGNGYEIKNCYINGNGYAGIFGSVKNAKILNLSVNGGSISGTGSYNGYNAVAGIVGFANDNVIIEKCKNSANIEKGAGIVGCARGNGIKIVDCINTGNISGGDRAAAGILGGESAEIINCYNLGTIGKSNGTGGIVGWISGKVENCYNAGEIEECEYSGAIIGRNIYIVSAHNCYYLDNGIKNGIQGIEDVSGQTERKTEYEMKSKQFADLLNEGRTKLDKETSEWIYINNEYPTFVETVNRTYATGNIEITNQKAGKVIVHHYLQGTGEEFGTTPEKLSEDEVINGKVPEEYTTSPNMQIKDYTLIKDEKGDYIIPSNASGTYTEQDQHVYYYYNKIPLKLTVHHYLEGTQEKLAEDEQTFYTEGDHYKTNASEEVLKKYNLTNVIGDEEKDITQNEEVTYYYQIKTHQITTKVEIPEGRSEKGGTITGEGETPYETVDYEQSSKKDIIITPEKGYKVKQIKLISTSEDGQKTESTIYGNDETEESELTYTEGENNTITLTKFQNMIADKEIIVIFEPDEGRLIVHHYIEESTEKIYDDQITVKPVGTKVETVPVKKDNYVVVKEPEDRNAIITKETQEKIYYYQKQYNITTEVIKHNETYKDGTIVKNVKGGTITDEGKKSHEYVLKDRNSQNEIIITPNDGYEIVKITINNETLDYKNLLDEKGKVTIPKEFFKNVKEDKHIQVEFRKKTKVYVKYLEEGTEQPLYTEENKDYIELNGYEGQEYETVKKVIPNYKDSTLGITDENKVQVQPKGVMYADDVTVIYWYTRVSSGIIVRHIETNEKGEEIELENNIIDGLAGLNQLTNRKKYDKYIPVDRKQENLGNVNSHITLAKKEENSKTVTFAQDKILEVWYFYEKQYDVTTSVKTHEEKVLNETTGKYETKQIAGGTISKEYEKDEQGNDKLDDKGNKIEITYEQILSRGDSKKQIELKPDENYRVKSVIKQKKIIKDGKEQYEEEQIFVEDKVQEDGSVILPEKLLVDVQNDYNIQVEFEKIPAKVIVQYKDAYTKESIHEDKILEGFINDEYNEQRISIESYIPANPEPENNYGKMTKEPITVTYWYTKQFKITAEVKPHEEEEPNNETGEIGKVQKEGGTIKIGENLPQELVTRGENSINTIIAIPDQNYRIKYVTINGKKIDLAKVLQENGTAKLPLFENMQEDKHIVVEFERIPTKLIVKHLDVETNNPITEDEQKDGFVGENYKTNPLNTKFYKLVDEKYPQNSEGKLTNEETIVTYYYEKLPFNLKIQKEVSNVLVNGEKLKVEENNIPMIIIAYKDIKDTTITIEYKIKVTNTESIAGKAVIEEKIPEGFELATESNPNWKKTEDTYTLQTDEILPGETKEYVVVLNWKQDTRNEGYKSNEAKIISTENEPKFDETTVLDNKDDAIVQIIINKTLQDVVDDIKDGNTKEVIKDIARSVKTGDVIIVSVITLAVFGTVLVIVLVKRKNEI